MTEAGIPDVGETDPAGKIVIVGEKYTDNWDPANAQTNMEQILTANNNEVDAVLSENDGMAGGVIAALDAQGLAGKVPVTGQDGDKAALNRVALGTQLVSVWKDARELGKAAGEAAIALCADPDLAEVAGTVQFDDAGWQHPDVDHPGPDARPAGQPPGRHRRRRRDQGRALRRASRPVPSPPARDRSSLVT